jgi:hypothetical protein
VSTELWAAAPFDTTNCWVLALPTLVSGKPRVVVSSEICGSTPVQSSVTVPVPLVALLVTVRVAVLPPLEVGVQRTVRSWLPPPATSNGVAGGDTRLNWPACAPLMASAVTFSGRLPEFEMVSVASSFVFLTTLPTLSGDGLRPMTRAVPVPLTETSKLASLESLLATRIVQARAPCTEGSKLTSNVPLAPGAMSPVNAVRLKSPHWPPTLLMLLTVSVPPGLEPRLSIVKVKSAVAPAVRS